MTVNVASIEWNSIEEQTFQVSLENGETVEYRIRGLSEDEVSKWSEFCASVFAYKPNPPSADYFYRHYANDPTTKAPGSSKLIRVATTVSEKGRIVATCRIFLKPISVAPPGTIDDNGTGNASADADATILWSGGIGEVCTDVRHRRRGLSTRLLQNAIAIMEDHRCCSNVSSLHASPVFFDLYQSLGYKTSRGNRWSIIDFDRAPNRNNQPTTVTTNAITATIGFRIRPAEFPRDTKMLRSIHQQYSEQRFAGCIVRNEDYWNDYLSKELEGSLYVLVVGDAEAEAASEASFGEASGSGPEQILSWLSLKEHGSIDGVSFCVQEFGINRPLLQKLNNNHKSNQPVFSMTRVVKALIAHAMEERARTGGRVSTSSSSSSSSDPVVRTVVKLPGFLCDELRSDIESACQSQSSSSEQELPIFHWQSEREFIDRGWMYRSVGGAHACNSATAEFLRFVQETNETATDGGETDETATNGRFGQREHFVWPSDSF